MIIGYLPSFSSAFLESENLKLAFNYLKNCLDKNEFPLAKVDIKGEEVYAIYSENGRGRELQLESHLKYIDIHFVIEGTDRFAYSQRALQMWLKCLLMLKMIYCYTLEILKWSSN
jgi:beta-galactosidase beta subunit